MPKVAQNCCRDQLSGTSLETMGEYSAGNFRKISDHWRFEQKIDDFDSFSSQAFYFSIHHLSYRHSISLQNILPVAWRPLVVAGIIAEEALTRLTRLTRLTTEQAQLESRAVSLPGSGLCPPVSAPVYRSSVWQSSSHPSVPTVPRSNVCGTCPRPLKQQRQHPGPGRHPTRQTTTF